MPKLFLTYSQQIAELKTKNLIIEDNSTTERILSQIGYFSLIVAYKKCFKNPTTRQYRAGTTFGNIVSLYLFDEDLRFYILSYLLKFERTIKAQIAYHFSDRYGEKQNQYLLNTNYNYVDPRKAGIDKLIERWLRPLAIASNDHQYIVHHRTHHNNVPLWVLVNALTFGNISSMFSFLPQSIQASICKDYPLLPDEMTSILAVLTFFRNVCAHGDRLFQFRVNKKSIPDLKLHASLKIRKVGPLYSCGKSDLFAVLVAMRYLLPNEEFVALKRDIAKHIAAFTSDCDTIKEVDLLIEMGFPPNWKEITRYKKLQ